MKIAVVGGLGKLGSAIINNLKDCYSFEAFDTKNNNVNLKCKYFDFIIDASCHTNTFVLAKKCANEKKPLLVVCTGHTEKELQAIINLNKKTTIKFCPNLSYGINVINSWLDKTTFADCNVNIFERHHTQKKDAPSGTALALEKICKKFAKSIEIVCSRFGDDIGTHVITIDMPFEQIIVSHHAKSREAFASGAKFQIEQTIKEHYEKYKN